MWKFWLSFFLFTLAVPLIPYAIFGELPGESWVEHPNPVYVFFISVILLGSDVFLPIPSSLVAVFLGARLGPVFGALAIFLGLNIGTAVGYYAGRRFGYPLVARYTSHGRREILQKLESRYSYLALAMVRSVPVLAEASVLGAGAAGFKPRPVLATLFVANTCLAMLYAGFGSASRDASSPFLLFLGGIGLPALGISVTYAAFRMASRSKR